MREHALFSRDRYATNRFMEPFRKHLSFAWPHSATDAYSINPKTELYGFTSLYIDHQSRIECWQMDPDFFNLFPELRREIPASSLSPSRPLISQANFGLTDDETIDEDTSASSFHQQEIVPVFNEAFVF
jgi:hypothetical protein